MSDFIVKVDEVRNSLIKQGLNYRIYDICKIACAMPAPQFYVDAKTALRNYCKYRNGLSCIRSIEKRKMYAEIFSRYENMANVIISTGQTLRKTEVMESVLNQPAPSFYYDFESATKMYYYIMSRRRRRVK